MGWPSAPRSPSLVSVKQILIPGQDYWTYLCEVGSVRYAAVQLSETVHHLYQRIVIKGVRFWVLRCYISTLPYASGGSEEPPPNVEMEYTPSTRGALRKSKISLTAA